MMLETTLAQASRRHRLCSEAQVLLFILQGNKDVPTLEKLGAAEGTTDLEAINDTLPSRG
jgi:hypothetical protein